MVRVFVLVFESTVLGSVESVVCATTSLGLVRTALSVSSRSGPWPNQSRVVAGMCGRGVNYGISTTGRGRSSWRNDSLGGVVAHDGPGEWPGPQRAFLRRDRHAAGAFVANLVCVHCSSPTSVRRELEVFIGLDSNFEHMEDHKVQAMRRLVHRSGKPVQKFYEAINGVADQLERAYDGLDASWRGANRETFVKMMVTDGCFLLETVWAVAHETGATAGDFTASDPRDPRSLLIWGRIRMDVVGMENQLPLFAIQKLETARRGGVAAAKNINEPALHPLDLLHRCYISIAVADRVSSPLDSKKWENTMPCAQVLSEAGIDFKKSRTRKFGDVEFKDPVLKGVTKSVVHMPMLRVRHDTERFLLNLMAFERLHPGAGDDVVSYVSFMRNMINNAADLFNNIYTGVLSPYSKLHLVQRKVSIHCDKRWNKLRARFVHAYLGNPWVFISLVAAIILLIATLLQTVYTVIPFYQHKS
nr:unnamed protein product [Digitaria exilis]